MSKLMKPSEYAMQEGISRQAVYAKIKKGTLEAKTIDGKMYIVVEEVSNEKELEKIEENTAGHLVDVKELLSSKDQTISILQESLSDLKHTNTEINTTLRGEIELLKQVFTEMRNLYVKQVDYMVVEKQQALSNHPNESVNELSLSEEKRDESWMRLEEFFEKSKIRKEKRKAKVLKRLRKAFMRNDARIKMEDEDIYLSCSHLYADILK